MGPLLYLQMSLVGPARVAQTLRKSIVKTQVLGTAEIDRSARVLGAALPAKRVYRPASAERTHASLVLWRLASS
jgi:hypothetical protein